MTRHLESLSERNWKNTPCEGFTLIELMVTITLIGIVMGIGVPSYQNLVVKNRIQTQTNDIRSSLAMARVEAIRRGLRVRVCPGTNGCVGTNWHQGWNSFVDRNGDNARDANETSLQVHIRLDGGSTLTGANNIVFKSDGTLIPMGTRVLMLCTADSHAQHRRRIAVSSVGRVRVCGPAAAGEPECSITCD